MSSLAVLKSSSRSWVQSGMNQAVSSSGVEFG